MDKPLVPPKMDSIEELQRAKLFLEYNALQRAENERTQAEMAAKNARESVARAVFDQERRDAATRELCEHKKPNGYSALAGQRDHSNVTHLLCQYCMQEWTGWKDVPPHLRIDIAKVGGPEMVG